jgi:hypothetical protein
MFVYDSAVLYSHEEILYREDEGSRQEKKTEEESRK